MESAIKKTMKPKIKTIVVILFTLIITGCNINAKSNNKSLEAFEFSQNCPNGCFLGMKPLVTTLTEANHILQSSPNIDQTTISILHDGGLILTENPDDEAVEQMKEGDILQAAWLPIDNKDFGFYTHITVVDDRIDKIDAQPLSTTIGDFVNILGEPDKIQVHGEQPPDADYWISYSMFFSKWRVQLHVFAASIEGPKPDDEIYFVILNQKINEPNWYEWKGYKNMKVYMTSEQLADYQRWHPNDSGNHP
jgi:hypothetical protein